MKLQSVWLFAYCFLITSRLGQSRIGPSTQFLSDRGLSVISNPPTSRSLATFRTQSVRKRPGVVPNLTLKQQVKYACEENPTALAALPTGTPSRKYCNDLFRRNCRRCCTGLWPVSAFTFLCNCRSLIFISPAMLRYCRFVTEVVEEEVMWFLLLSAISEPSGFDQ